MRFRSIAILLGFLLTAQCAFAQGEINLTGTIKSKESGETVPRASVSIIGSNRGTIANKEGAFILPLEKDKQYKLRIRAIGFKPDTVTVQLSTSEARTFTLTTEAIMGKEIVVSSDASRT